MASRIDQLREAGLTFEDPASIDAYDEDALDELTNDEFDELKCALEKVKGAYGPQQVSHFRWI